MLHRPMRRHCGRWHRSARRNTRQVMRPALKYANNTYEYSKYDTSMFTKNSEYLTLPSQNEAYGLNNISYINSHINIYPAELTLMQQYDYFKAGNSVQAFLETDTSNNVRYWSRSADPGKILFCFHTKQRSDHIYNARYEFT